MKLVIVYNRGHATVGKELWPIILFDYASLARTWPNLRTLWINGQPILTLRVPLSNPFHHAFSAILTNQAAIYLYAPLARASFWGAAIAKSSIFDPSNFPACEGNRNFVKGSWLCTFPRVQWINICEALMLRPNEQTVFDIYHSWRKFGNQHLGCMKFVVIGGTVMNRSACILII